MNDGFDFPRSYYAATANAFAPAPKLEGEHRCDVAVIGGGYTGLHAALNAAEAGFNVALVEGGRIGWGASGRNGGQMIPGWRKGVVELAVRYGRVKARTLLKLALEARTLAVEAIDRHGIACDLALKGHLNAAAKPSDLAWMRGEVETLARDMDYTHTRMLSREEVEARVASTLFHGGVLDEGGGHLHPLNYALGLADAARRAGIALYELSPAIAIDEGADLTVRTPHGALRARYVVLACDALLGALEPRIAGHIMPVANYVVATEPLEQRPVTDDLAVSDSRCVVNYFRMSADRRLLFSGGERYTPSPPASIEAFVRPYLARVFPELAHARIDHAWGGLVSVTLSRLPHVGRLGAIFYAHGYSGQGVLISALAGKVLIEAMRGTAERFDVLASLAPPAFPGGALMRSPLYTLGMLYYALRDRL